MLAEDLFLVLQDHALEHQYALVIPSPYNYFWIGTKRSRSSSGIDWYGKSRVRYHHSVRPLCSKTRTMGDGHTGWSNYPTISSVNPMGSY